MNGKMNILYGMAQAFVEKYNSEYGTNLQIQHTSDDGFRLPYIKNEQLYIDKSIFTCLTLYFFGNPYISHYYRLLKGMADYRCPDKALQLLELIKQEYQKSAKDIKHLISCNPEWIPTQVMVITIHELAHHLFTRDPNLCASLKADVKQYLIEKPFIISDSLPDVDFGVLGISLEELNGSILEFYDAMIEDDLEDESFMEELAADTVVFKHLSSALENCGVEMAISVMCASLVCFVFFIEYANRIEHIFFTPITPDKKERFKINLARQIQSSINCRLRAIYQDYHINEFWKTLAISKDAKQLYSILCGTPLSKFNGSLDADFMESLQVFQNSLNEGCQIEFDREKLSMIRHEIIDFENEIIDYLISEISKRNGIPLSFI